MERFKIIAMPPGQAPEWVRKEWIGLELPMIPMESVLFQVGVFGGTPEKLDGYPADAQVAIDLLSKKSPKAAEWWRDNAPHVLADSLVFKKEVCEVI